MTFTLTKGATTVVLQDPRFGNGNEVTREQTLGTTSSGKGVVYDRGAETEELTFTWDNLDYDDRVALQSFFSTDAVGAKNPFDFEWDDWIPAVFGGTGGTITKSNWYFATPRLSWVDRRNGQFQVTIVFRNK